MALPLSVAWPGGLPCPWTRGTVDTVACRETARGKRWSQRSRPCMKLPTCVGSGAGLVGGALAAGVGHASTVRPDPSTLGAVGVGGSHREDCSQSGSGAAAVVHNHLVARQAGAVDDAGYAGTTCRSAGPAVATHTPRGPAASTSWTSQGGPRSHPATRPEPGSTRSKRPLSSNPPEYGPPSQTAPPPTTGPTARLRARSGSGVVAVTLPVRWSRRASRPVRSRSLPEGSVPDSTHTAPASAANPYPVPGTRTARAGPPASGTRHSRSSSGVWVQTASVPTASRPTGWCLPEASVTTSGGRGRSVRASMRLKPMGLYPRRQQYDHSTPWATATTKPPNRAVTRRRTGSTRVVIVACPLPTQTAPAPTASGPVGAPSSRRPVT